MHDSTPSAEKHEAALASLGKKANLICDHCRAVVEGYKTAFYLYGPGGVGKSFLVLQYLESLAAAYQLWNTRMTAKGLYQTLEHSPDAIHVLEDMERLTKDSDAQGVLRSACWSQPGRERVVTWTTATEGARKFTFRGGLILLSNRPLADLPELRALATRIEVYHFEATDAEMAAKMRQLAAMGYRLHGNVGISPDECLQVTEYLLKECRAAGCTLDLRLQQKAFQSYMQYAADCCFSHWEDLVTASVREAMCHFRHEPNKASPEEKKAKRRNVLREIIATEPDEKQHEKLYWDRTRMARADFYRRKSEVVSREFDEYDRELLP